MRALRLNPVLNPVHMSHGRHRTVLAALVSVVLLAAVASPAAAQTEPAAGAPPSMILVDRSPWVAPGGTFELDIATRDAAGSALLQVRIHDELDSVDDLERSMEEDVGPVIHRPPAVPLGFVAPGPDGNRTVRVPTSTSAGDRITARLPDPGVYPLVLTMQGSSGAVSEIRTPVVRLGTEEDPLVAPRIELVADVSLPPTIEPDGRRPLEERELERLGRLAALLEGTAGADARGAPEEPAPLDATVAASPDTLDALAASTDDRAASLLEALTGTRADRTALGLPTVPISAAALVDADLGLFVLALLQDGREALEDRLDIPIETAVWDAGTGIDRQSAALLAETGITHLLVDAPRDTDPAAAERQLVPAGPYPTEETAPLEVLLVDRATSDALASPAADRADAAHVAMADLLLRDDGRASRVVLRVDGASEDSPLAPTLALLSAPGSPIEVAPLSTVPPGSPPAGDEPAPDETLPGSGPAPEDLAIPEASEDLSEIAPLVRETTAAVGSFGGLVGTESARADTHHLHIATSLAAGIDDDRRLRLLEGVAADVEQAFDGVVLTGQTDLNLTSRSGTLPLQIRNDNDFPVRVVLEISSDRLLFPEGERFEIEAASEITRIDIPVQARATGSVPTFVELTTPDGRVVLEARRLNVRSTAISGVGLALSLGALAVLVIWWLRTWRRNRSST